MNYGQEKKMVGNGCRVYITRLKPLYSWQPDRWIVNAYAPVGQGKQSRLTEFKTEQEAMIFAEDFINN